MHNEDGRKPAKSADSWKMTKLKWHTQDTPFFGVLFALSKPQSPLLSERLIAIRHQTASVCTERTKSMGSHIQALQTPHTGCSPKER